MNTRIARTRTSASKYDPLPRGIENARSLNIHSMGFVMKCVFPEPPRPMTINVQNLCVAIVIQAQNLKPATRLAQFDQQLKR